MEYKGFKIVEVYRYSNGRSDFQVYPPHGEYGTLEPNTTLERIKQQIDESN